jgi:hypothetical protein
MAKTGKSSDVVSEVTAKSIVSRGRRRAEFHPSAPPIVCCKIAAWHSGFLAILIAD